MADLREWVDLCVVPGQKITVDETVAERCQEIPHTWGREEITVHVPEIGDRFSADCDVIEGHELFEIRVLERPFEAFTDRGKHGRFGIIGHGIVFIDFEI